MIEVKTAELIGPALDWAVAKSIGAYRGEYLVCEGGEPWPAWIFPEWFPVKATTGAFSPSENWDQGGPLIAAHRVSVIYSDETCGPCAWTDSTAPWHGSTPLISACRAIVAAKLGDVVSVPTELI